MSISDFPPCHVAIQDMSHIGTEGKLLDSNKNYVHLLITVIYLKVTRYPREYKTMQKKSFFFEQEFNQENCWK